MTTSSSLHAQQSSLAGLFEAQRRFDELRAAALRRNRGRLLDLSYANPAVEIAPDVRAALVEAASNLTTSELQYTPYGGATKARRLVATSLATSTQLPFTYRDVVLTAGATAALSIAIGAAFSPGDEVLLSRPTWPDYPLFCAATASVAASWI